MLLGFRDPVADAIGLLRPSTSIGPSVQATGEWAARFDGSAHMRTGFVARGGCWLLLQGHEPVRLERGDYYLLGNPDPYVLSGTPTADPRSAVRVGGNAAGGVVRIGPEAEDDTYVCDGRFTFEDANASVLTDILPRLVVVPSTDPRARHLALVCELLVIELEADAAGGPLVLNHLGQIMLVHMLRAHASRTGRPVGWLCALNDDGIGAALRAMHADMARSWTLRELAEAGHMSRSAFARTFKERVGVPPLEYLIQWRMSLARDALRQGTLSIPELASATGYRSESAFSTAFRRVVGVSPARFRSRARSAADAEARPA